MENAPPWPGIQTRSDSAMVSDPSGGGFVTLLLTVSFGAFLRGFSESGTALPAAPRKAAPRCPSIGSEGRGLSGREP